MSPKGLVLLLVVGLCATQISAHREARGIEDLLQSAKSKLQGLISNVKDAASSSVEVVYKNMEKLEDLVLSAGTKHLKAAGIELNLNDLADLLKDNVKVCASDDAVKAEVKSILGNVGSCITKDVTTLNSLAGKMTGMWGTAKSLPKVMEKVSAQCGAHADESAAAVADAIPDVDDDDDDLAEEVNQILADASHRVSKRAIWNLERITRCVKSVYTLAKKDMVNIPGEIVATASDAFKLVKSVQGGIPACVGQRLAESSADITKLATKVGSCIASSVANDDDLEELIAKNPGMKVLKQLTGVAKQLNAFQDSSALSALRTAAKLFG